MKRAISRMYIARLQLGLTQKDVADALGVTQPRISSWENLLVSVPEARREALSRLLNVPEGELDRDLAYVE